MGRKTWDAASGGPFGGSSMATYVFSRSRPAGGEKPGKHLWLMGGRELAREFLKADLVDELYLGVVPVLLGEGIPLFPSGFPQRDFSLTEHKSYSKGLITLSTNAFDQRPNDRGSCSRLILPS